MMLARPSRRARLAVQSDRVTERSLKVIRAVHGGFWLGIMDRQDLDDAAQVAYSSWPKYSDDTYNLSGLSNWEHTVVTSDFPSDGTVFVPSAGGGREVIALARLGFRSIGSDPAVELVKAANRLSDEHKLDCVVYLEEPGQAALKAEAPFDAVLVGWGGYHHIAGRNARLEFLRALHNQMVTGAPLLLSFFVRRDDDPYVRITTRVARRLQRLRRRPDTVQLGDAVNSTFDHYFSWSEVTDEVESAGFAVKRCVASPYGHLVATAQPAS